MLDRGRAQPSVASRHRNVDTDQQPEFAWTPMKFEGTMPHLTESQLLYIRILAEVD